MAVLVRLFGVRLATRSPLALLIKECCVCAEITIFQLANCQCYQELNECLEPLKALSLLLESSTEATLHNTLDYFLCCWTTNWESQRKGETTCEEFNAFDDAFQRKLLMLLADVEQFFLWAAAVDGRKIDFDCLKPVWENHIE